MGKFYFGILSAVMTGLLLLSAVQTFAQDAEWVYRQQMDKARSDRQNGKYKRQPPPPHAHFFWRMNSKMSAGLAVLRLNFPSAPMPRRRIPESRSRAP